MNLANDVEYKELLDCVISSTDMNVLIEARNDLAQYEKSIHSIIEKIRLNRAICLINAWIKILEEESMAVN